MIRITKEAKIKNFPIWTPKMGQIIQLDSNNETKYWWEGIE
jgi:hypothetical protein